MKLRSLILFAAIFIVNAVHAQNVLKGSVYDSANGAKMGDVFVRDNANRQLTITDKNGSFAIRTETGHTIIFSSPGYVSDTLYVVDFLPKKIQLITQTINLRQVNITATKETFDSHKEYPEIYTRSKVYPLSPSSWFSKDARDARRLKKYFKREEEERHVDEVYTPAYVGGIVPLKGQDLENFMNMYRPSYAFIQSNNGPSLAVYINDSYKKFMALPADKRVLPKLTSSTVPVN